MRITKPYADLLPPLSTEDREALRIDIECEGVRNECLSTEDGRLLDGHNRLEIDASAPIDIVEGSGEWSDAECHAYMIRRARGNRNLSIEQQRDLEKLARKTAVALNRQDPVKYKQQVLADMFGVHQQRICEWIERDTITVSGNCVPDRPDAKTKVPADHREVIANRFDGGEMQSQIASDYQISVSRVKKIVAGVRKRREKETAREAAAEAGRKLEIEGFHHGDFRDIAKGMPDNLIPFPWFCAKTGYAIGRMGGQKLLLMHRVILNAPSEFHVDHRNRDPLDNRRGNLRLCTPPFNAGNRPVQMQAGRTSRYKGVCLARREGVWIAYIYSAGKQRRLGYFHNERDAAIAYNAAARIQFGEFARLNEVEI